MIKVKHGFVDTRGFRMHVAEAGNGPPLLLLHGWPEFWATWEPMFERLAGRWRLIAPDFRGFGESGNPDAGRTDQAGPGVLADDIAALMDALAIERAGFVGHDIGAFVMQRLALDHPARVAGLFFFNCATHGVGTRFRDPRQINEIWYQTFHQMPFAPQLVGASRESCRAYFRHFLTHWSHRKDAFDAVIERWVDNFLRPGNLQGGFNWYVSQNAGRLAVMAGTAPGRRRSGSRPASSGAGTIPSCAATGSTSCRTISRTWRRASRRMPATSSTTRRPIRQRRKSIASSPGSAIAADERLSAACAACAFRRARGRLSQGS